jgi:hypothetical protein
MRHVRQLPAALPVFFGLVFIPVFQGVAEELYRWKDRSGALCFSNVSPPAGVREYSNLTGASSEPGPMMSGGAPGDAEGGERGKPVKDAPEDAHGSMADILRDRIQQRELSIVHLEVLLKSQPNDAYLRRCFFEKKQKLQEDRIRLKLMSD